MEYFMPIVTINENTKEGKKEKKEKKKPAAPVEKKKRGRPSKKNSTDIEKDADYSPTSYKPKKTKKGKSELTPAQKPETETTNGTGIKIKEEFNIKEEELDIDYTLPILDTEEDSKTFQCPICKDDKQYTLKLLKLHYKEEHKGKRLRSSRYSSETHSCDICTKHFKSPSGLKEHIETHNNYYHCEQCNAAQKKLLDYVIHLRSHSEENIFKCIVCEFITEDINVITDHMNTNHEEGQHKYWCEGCKKGFHLLSWFQEHDNYHTGLKPYDCEFCGKCFFYSRYLYAHKNNIHADELINAPPKFHECVICKKQYQHKNSLKLHMNSHTGNFSICDICGKMLSSKEKLKFHLRTHTGYKPFNCQYCGKCFTKKPILVEHVRIHTGERPYVCEYCTKAFSQRSSLVIHIRSHTGEKPYVCHVCNKGFVAKAMLNIHLKSCKGIMCN